jgi:hypothetical protein
MSHPPPGAVFVRQLPAARAGEKSAHIHSGANAFHAVSSFICVLFFRTYDNVGHIMGRMRSDALIFVGYGRGVIALGVEFFRHHKNFLRACVDTEAAALASVRIKGYFRHWQLILPFYEIFDCAV